MGRSWVDPSAKVHVVWKPEDFIAILQPNPMLKPPPHATSQKHKDN